MINKEYKITIVIIQYSNTAYRDHEGLGFLSPKNHLKNSLTYTLWHPGSID